MGAQGQIQLIVNVLFAAGFIGWFYFTTTKRIEGETVTNNVRALFPNVSVPELSGTAKTVVCQTLSSVTSNWPIPDDTSVQTSNEELLARGTDALKKAFMIGIGLSAAIYLFRNRNKSFSFGRIAKNAAISLASIAAAEWLFVYIVVGNAVYVDQRDAVRTFLRRPDAKVTIDAHGFSGIRQHLESLDG